MTIKKNDLISIIIPAYNEADSIREVIEDVRKGFASHKVEILVIDDGSNDQTAEMAKKGGAKVIQHLHNKGYGASLKSGIRAAAGQFMLFLDADGQHRAVEALKLIDAASSTSADMVVGQRSKMMHSPLWRMPGKWVLGWMANYLTRRRIPDLNSGLRLINREVALRYMVLCPNGFSFSTTITMVLINRGFEVLYVPFEINKRKGKSTVSLSTGLDTLLLIIRIATLIDPLRIFIPLSLLIAFIGIAWGIPYALMGNGVSIGSMLAIVTSVLLFSIGLISDQISQLRLEKM
jgi:glycosyltransferase involved in cell wall biosynthesis